MRLIEKCNERMFGQLDLIPVVVLLLPVYAVDCEQTSFRHFTCGGTVVTDVCS